MGLLYRSQLPGYLENIPGDKRLTIPHMVEAIPCCRGGSGVGTLASPLGGVPFLGWIRLLQETPIREHLCRQGRRKRPYRLMPSQAALSKTYSPVTPVK
jgi:hypothetical protein